MPKVAQCKTSEDVMRPARTDALLVQWAPYHGTRPPQSAALQTVYPL